MAGGAAVADPTARRLAELAERASERGDAVFTRFMDPAQQITASRLARDNGVELELWGGYTDAERCVGAFHTGDAGFDWPLTCVRADWRAAYGSPAHRDVLGAAMAIVQDRSRFGDIVMCGGYALLFCLTELADHVVMALTSAGRSTLRCIICDDVNAAAHKRDELRERRDTIPSFRLDACVASAFDLSRADAQSLINEGKVRLNHLPAIKCDAQVGESGLVSVRGIGRAVLKEKRGMNRKGRFGVLWECTFS